MWLVTGLDGARLVRDVQEVVVMVRELGVYELIPGTSSDA